MEDVQILGVDLGKNSCSVVGLDAAGHVLQMGRAIRCAVGRAVRPHIGAPR